MTSKRVGELMLPTGAIVACDPLVGILTAQPFARTVRPGRYMATYAHQDGDAVLAMLRFSDAPVARWEPTPTFDVDAASACFVDASRTQTVEVDLARLPIVVGDGVLVAFPCNGDGIFRSYWGLDANGEAVMLVTDFGVLRDAVDEDVPDEPRSDRDEPASMISPSLIGARQILATWEANKHVELTRKANRTVLAEALVEELTRLEGRRDLGAALSEWLLDRADVEDVFATDDELASALRVPQPR